MKLTSAELEPLVEEGGYNARVESIEPFTGGNPSFGQSLQIIFKIVEGPDKGKNVSGLCNIKDGKIRPGTKAAEWFISMGMDEDTLTTPGNAFDTNDFINAKVRILVVHKTGSKGGLMSVVDKVRRRKAGQTSPDEDEDDASDRNLGRGGAAAAEKPAAAAAKPKPRPAPAEDGDAAPPAKAKPVAAKDDDDF
jgi:ribosomal protein S28E/S33